MIDDVKKNFQDARRWLTRRDRWQRTGMPRLPAYLRSSSKFAWVGRPLGSYSSQQAITWTYSRETVLVTCKLAARRQGTGWPFLGNEPAVASINTIAKEQSANVAKTFRVEPSKTRFIERQMSCTMLPCWSVIFPSLWRGLPQGEALGKAGA
jgi:hypothetical protein